MVAMQVLTMLKAYVGLHGRDEKGQTMAEYGLLLSGIAIVAFVGVLLVGPAIEDLFTDISVSLGAEAAPVVPAE